MLPAKLGALRCASLEYLIACMPSRRMKTYKSRWGRSAAYTGPPGSRGELHPPAPTDPDVNLSIHPALVTLVTRRRGSTASARTDEGTGQ